LKAPFLFAGRRKQPKAVGTLAVFTAIISTAAGQPSSRLYRWRIEPSPGDP
jgi:hypothetical protein